MTTLFANFSQNEAIIISSEISTELYAEKIQLGCVEQKWFNIYKTRKGDHL